NLLDGNIDVTLDDSADTFARNVTLNAVGDVYGIAGLAPGNITYRMQHGHNLIINGGSGGNTFNVVKNTEVFLALVPLYSGAGADTVNVRALSELSTGLFINGVAGRDRVNVGNAGSTQGIRSFLDVRNDGGFTDLILDDSADPVGRSVTMTARAPGQVSS